MATLSTLVKAIADVQGLDENQVLWIARHLREDGLISQGGRGRGGAQMLPKDATNLLLGVNAPGTAKEAAQQVRTFRRMQLNNLRYDQEDISRLSKASGTFRSALHNRALFGDTVEALITEYMHEPLPIYSVRVQISGPIKLSGLIYLVHVEEENSKFTSIKLEYYRNVPGLTTVLRVPDQERSTSFSSTTLEEVGSLLAS